MNITLGEELTFRGAGKVVRFGAIALLLAVTFLPVFVDLHAKFSESDSYYSHGYLIPVVSGFLVWRKRHQLRSMRVVPSRVGLWVLAGGLLLHLFARWWYVNFVANFSLLVVLGGLSLYLFGTAVTRQLLFPLAFLIFMIPLPKISIIYITFWLKLFVASAASETVAAMGVPVLLEGAFIRLPNGLLEIDNACSGLRSLLALTALGVAYASLLPVSLMRKSIVALLSIPIAIVVNLIRIVILIWVSYLYSPGGRAFEIADFTTGFSIFLFALAGLYVVSTGVLAWERHRGAPAGRLSNSGSIGEVAAQAGGQANVIAQGKPSQSQRRYSVIIGMLLVSALLSWAVSRSQVRDYEVRLDEFPAVIGSWRGRDVELRNIDRVYAVLETRNVLLRLYENSAAPGEAVHVLVTYFKRGQRGFHPPETSFVASGNTITKTGVVRIPLGDDENAPRVEANMFLGRTPGGQVLFLYWFGIGDSLMASYVKGSLYLLWNAILQRPSPASMVRVALPVVDGDVEHAMATAREFIRQTVPILPAYLKERPRTAVPGG